MRRTPTTVDLEQGELSGMIATLCSYEDLFGPYHPQTLAFMTEVAEVCIRHGELAHARALLQRAVRDVGQYFGSSHDVRLKALTTLRDLFVEQHDYENAGIVQRELLKSCSERCGEDHPEVLQIRASFASGLLSSLDHAPNGKSGPAPDARLADCLGKNAAVEEPL